MLGHRNLKITLTYTQLIDLPQNEEYICKITGNIKEAKELVESGFEYVTTLDGSSLFKKRKNLIFGYIIPPKGPVV